ncbi:MAG TPA: hypothetical protein VKK79_11870, partial [Candidatus Lokiarchaeia archaeon]|nr:hypothetical protein [Candidatus Lokiarchaeia archaeon]
YFRNTVAFGFFPSNLAPSITPPGKQLFTVFRPLSAEMIADHDTYVASLAELREEVEECFPDLHDAILFERDLAIRMADGAEVNVDQHRLKRPSCELPVPGVDNLWVCGDSTSGAGAGGDIGHESVRMLHRVLMVKS